MNTHESYVSLEIAKMLKEAGFDWECDYHYADNTLCHEFCNNDPMFKIIISAPTLDVAQRWLREVKNIQVFVSPVYGPKNWTPLIAKDFWLLHEDIGGIAITSENFDTYELALESGIKKTIELILEKGE